MTALRNWLAYHAFIVWPTYQNMPRWRRNISDWLAPMAVAWAYRDLPDRPR